MKFPALSASGRFVRVCASVSFLFASGHAEATEGVGSADSNADSVESEQAVPGMLSPLSVTAPVYRVRLTLLEKLKWQIFTELTAKYGWPPTAGDFVVTPERVAQTRLNSVNNTEVIDDERLHTSGTNFFGNLGLAFIDLYRIRGPDWRRGQSPRALLDGIVMNDAFDGSVREAELPTASLARIEFSRNGGATAWGEAPLGVLQFFAMPAIGKIVREPQPPDADSNYPLPPKETVHGTGLFHAEIGEFATQSLEFVHTEPTPTGMVQVLARASATGGYITSLGPTIPLDTPEWTRNHWLEARWRRPLSKHIEVTATIETVKASRGLGTPYQRAETSGFSTSLSLAGSAPSSFAWNAIAFFQQRQSSRTFSAANHSMGTETPILDESAEPVSVTGLAWTGAWTHEADARTNIGIDVRWMYGETETQIDFVNGRFAREIVAGADHDSAGLFLIHNRRLTRNWRGLIGIRGDFWDETDGHVRVLDGDSGAALSERRETRLHQFELSPSAGLRWVPRANWRLRLAAQKSFRPPTLAERYRLSGERNWLIEPAASLKTEHSSTTEFGAEYVFAKSVVLTATVSATQLHDVPATRTITSDDTSGVDSNPLNLVVHRRIRSTLDLVDVKSFQLTAHFGYHTKGSVDVGFIFENASIREAESSPAAIGKQAPGSPHMVGFSTLSWTIAPKLTVSCKVQWLSRDFLDAENAVPLGSAVVVDCAATYHLTQRTNLFLQVNNLGSTVIEGMRAPDATRYRSGPRRVTTGMDVAW